MTQVQWHGWVRHLASKAWHEVAHSEDFDVVYAALERFVKDNAAIVKCRVLMTGVDPANVPSDFPEPFELKG